jgi:hypothetical protein
MAWRKSRSEVTDDLPKLDSRNINNVSVWTTLPTGAVFFGGWLRVVVVKNQDDLERTFLINILRIVCLQLGSLQYPQLQMISQSEF